MNLSFLKNLRRLDPTICIYAMEKEKNTFFNFVFSREFHWTIMYVWHIKASSAMWFSLTFINKPLIRQIIPNILYSCIESKWKMIQNTADKFSTNKANVALYPPTKAANRPPSKYHSTLLNQLYCKCGQLWYYLNICQNVSEQK